MTDPPADARGDAPADGADERPTDSWEDRGPDDTAAGTGQSDVAAATAVDDRDGAAAVAEDERFRLPRAPIEPESPSLENALFVLLGALGTIALLAASILPAVR
ncbi:DUF7312 domain-containing protein [Halobellus sp. GM3]|uniref:DUF7312 domain-containing protein n=1 Tax=Halobellus sp. GM3 TaxID=3458410 RepID=UPI00403DAA28